MSYDLYFRTYILRSSKDKVKTFKKDNVAYGL